MIIGSTPCYFVIRYLGKVCGFSGSEGEAQRLTAYLSESGDPATFERREGPMPVDHDAEVARLRAEDARASRPQLTLIRGGLSRAGAALC